MTPRHLLEVPMTKAYWTFALASLYSPPVAMCAAAVAEGRLPVEALDPTRPCRVRLLVDQGEGPLEVARLFAGPNIDGLSYARGEVAGRAIRAVVLGVGEGPAVLRLDWMRLVCFRQGEPKPSIIELTGTNGFPATMLRNGRPLSENVLLAHSAPPDVVYTCPPTWGSSVYKVDVEMAFAWMPLPPLPSQPAGNTEVLLHAARLVGRRAGKAWASAAREASDRFRPRT